MEAVVPSILIAVDDSKNRDAAHKKALEIFDKYSRKGPVCITRFNHLVEWFHVDSLEQADSLLDQDYLCHITNKWPLLFSRIAEVYCSYSQKAKVLIISDLLDTKTLLATELQRLEQSPPNERLKIKFCQIGGSQTALGPSELPRMHKIIVSHVVD